VSAPRRGHSLTATVASIAVAAFVFGASFGVLATGEGIPGWQAVAASATVFAGAAQFAALSVQQDGGSSLAVVVTGVLLNLRYLVTGAAVASALPGGLGRRAATAQLVVDESYALGAAAGPPGRPDAGVIVRVGSALWCSWVGGTFAGVLLGDRLGDPGSYGLDAAFPALFIAILWPLVQHRSAAVAAFGGAGVALVLAPFTPAGVPLAAAAVIGLVLSR